VVSVKKKNEGGTFLSGLKDRKKRGPLDLVEDGNQTGKPTTEQQSVGKGGRKRKGRAGGGIYYLRKTADMLVYCPSKQRKTRNHGGWVGFREHVEGGERRGVEK